MPLLRSQSAEQQQQRKRWLVIGSRGRRLGLDGMVVFGLIDKAKQESP